MPHLVTDSDNVVTDQGSAAIINRLGNGLKFISANTNRVRIASSADLNFGTSDFTISGSFIWTGTGSAAQRIINKTDYTFLKYGYLINIPTSKLFTFALYSNTSDAGAAIIRANTVLVANKVYKYSVVKVGSTVANWKIYLNGVSQPIINGNPSVTTFAGTIDNASPFDIGGYQQDATTYNFHFDGFHHYLKLHGAALAVEDIEKINATDGAYTPESNLKEAWNFNQKSGTTLKGMRGNDGSLVNFVNTSLGVNNQWVNKNQIAITA